MSLVFLQRSVSGFRNEDLGCLCAVEDVRFMWDGMSGKPSQSPDLAPALGLLDEDVNPKP